MVCVCMWVSSVSIFALVAPLMLRDAQRRVECFAGSQLGLGFRRKELHLLENCFCRY